MEFRMEAADGQFKREFLDRLTRFRVFVQNCAQKKMKMLMNNTKK
jgi:hypothetical protein